MPNNLVSGKTRTSRRIAFLAAAISLGLGSSAGVPAQASDTWPHFDRPSAASGHQAPGSGLFAGTAWERVAKSHGLDPNLLYAIALQESRRLSTDNLARPWPWTLNINGSARRFETRQELEEALQDLLNQGIRSIDVGLMQVNLKHHANRVDNPLDLVDPETNIRVAASILKDSLASTSDYILGVGRYHHWKNESVSRAYGTEVVALAERLKAHFSGDHEHWVSRN